MSLNPPSTPEEREEWIAKLRADHVSETAIVRVDMAADALRRAFVDPDEYVRCMELVDRHLKAAQEADRAWVKAKVRALKGVRDKGDAITGRIGKLGRPRVVEG